jgi:hypothetical protein
LDSYQTYPPRRDAVLCSLAELPDGGLRVVLDDLRQSDTPGHWKNHVFVTFKDYPAGQLDPATLPKGARGFRPLCSGSPVGHQWLPA